MDKKITNANYSKGDFYKIIQKAYNKGLTDKDITVKKILDEIKRDLMLIRL
ncbi:hypothetical protein [Neobacillus sp. LXY-4]|uniref:hypothetical protein n=1 Tax=Neobacillus sp. LXY-4 TaxID=3379826 RepID=UPI003EDEBA87